MAGVKDIAVNQGESYAMKITYRDSLGVAKDLTGWSGRGQIRLKATDTAALASFTVTISDPTNGVVVAALAADALSGNANIKGKSYSETTAAVYDIEIYNGATVKRLVNGACLISPEVTK